MPKNNNIDKNEPITIGTAVRKIWEKIRSLENVLAVFLIMDNGDTIIKQPITFWKQRTSKLLQIIIPFARGVDVSEKLKIHDTLSVGTDAYKVIAIVVAPAVFVVLFKGTIDPGNWTVTVDNVKTIVSNILGNLFLSRK